MDICKRNAPVGEMLVEDMNVHRLTYADDSIMGRETEWSSGNVKLYNAVRSKDLNINVSQHKKIVFDRENALRAASDT